MEIQDRVYGNVVIEEPVLLKLIASKPVQRLKGINQHGASQYVISALNVTRYEHSLGVMILLRKLGASIEEQIAGLLHDTPHTAFSHVIDYCFKNKEFNYHERFHEKIILNSEIPEILKEYGYDVERILDENNFPLLEKSIPDLCADRIDYGIRDAMAIFGSSRFKSYISHLKTRDGEIIIDDKDVALQLAIDYIDTNIELWAGPMHIALFQILADAMKIALDNGILTEEDLFQDDKYVYDKLKQSGNSEIAKKLAMINPNFKFTTDPDNYDFYGKSKARYVDPKFIDADGSVKRVSEVSSEFREKVQQHKDWVEKGHYIRITLQHNI